MQQARTRPKHGGDRLSTGDVTNKLALVNGTALKERVPSSERRRCNGHVARGTPAIDSAPPTDVRLKKKKKKEEEEEEQKQEQEQEKEKDEDEGQEEEEEDEKEKKKTKRKATQPDGLLTDNNLFENRPKFSQWRRCERSISHYFVVFVRASGFRAVVTCCIMCKWNAIAIRLFAKQGSETERQI